MVVRVCRIFLNALAVIAVVSIAAAGSHARAQQATGAPASVTPTPINPGHARQTIDARDWTPATPAEFAACHAVMVNRCFKPSPCEWKGQDGPCMVSTCNLIIAMDKSGQESFFGPGGYDGGPGNFPAGTTISKGAWEEFRSNTLQTFLADQNRIVTCGTKQEASILLGAYGGPGDRMRASGIAARVITPEGIKTCENVFDGLRKNILGGTGSDREKAQRLGRMQKIFFSGGCAIHPEARARLAEAEGMLAGRLSATGVPLGVGASGGAAAVGGGGSGGGGSSQTASTPVKEKRSNVPEAVATNCLSLRKNDSLYGGFVNSCDYAVEFVWCNVQPPEGSSSEAFDCHKNKTGSWQVSANSGSTQHTRGTSVNVFACKYGETLHKPIGISPAGVVWNATIGRLQGRCAEWGAK